MTDRKKQQDAFPIAPARAIGPAPGLRRVHSTELLGRADQVIIEHAGREYRLRVTSNGKLILTA